jgi:hypothetical protein
MANTYTQLYTQFVFSVKGRENLINEAFRDELEKVICGIINNQKCKTYAIYCNPDHTHVLVSMPLIAIFPAPPGIHFLHIKYSITLGFTAVLCVYLIIGSCPAYRGGRCVSFHFEKKQ